MNIKISPEKIRNCLTAQCFHGRIALRKLYINNRHRIKWKFLAKKTKDSTYSGQIE